MSKVEQRFICQESAQVRIEKREDGSQFITGYGIVFYNPAEPGTEYRMSGDWHERIDPASVDQSLSGGADITSTFNHNRDALLGRTSAGTLTLTKDSRGVRFEVPYDANDPDHNRVKAKIDRGDLRGASFTFRELAYDNKERDNGKKVWRVKSMELIEIGPVTEPAYTATSAGFRMSEDRTAKLAEIETQERAAQAAAERRARVASLL